MGRRAGRLPDGGPARQAGNRRGPGGVPTTRHLDTEGQVNYLEDQSSFSTIVLNLTEPGAGGAARPRGRLERAWATALDGLGVMAATALVALVWLTPVAVLAGLVLLLLRAARRRVPHRVGS